MRGPNRPDHESQERTHHIRSAARKGQTPTEIADAHNLPVAAVKRLLTPVEHPRLSDPVDLIRTGRAGPGKASADVQLYWLGFLMAAGHIHGQGASLALIVTLGDGGRQRMEVLQRDLMPGHSRCEFCESSLVGWQGYLRDPALCKALLPWGIPSDLDGEDAALLQDLREEMVAPFLRGYTEGDSLSRPSAEDGRFILHGTPALLAEINALLHRWWGISGGVITRARTGANLCFSSAVARRAILNRLAISA